MPLLAADILGWLIPIVFLVLYVVNHLLGAGKPADQPPPQRRRSGEPAGGAPGGGQPPRQDRSSQLNAEIEQFLKRANARRSEKSRRESPARPPAPPVAAPRAEQPVDVVPLERSDFDAVDESVREHFADRGFQQRAATMAVEIGRADVQMQQHLESVFDHRLGALDAGSRSSGGERPAGGPADRGPRPAARAAAGLLVHPRDLRRAIVLKEILERPVERW